MYIGVISNFIVFPINFLIVTLFRKARPLRKRSSRIQDALQKVEAQRKERTSQMNDEFVPMVKDRYGGMVTSN